MSRKKPQYERSYDAAVDLLQRIAPQVFTTELHPKIAAKRSTSKVPYNKIDFVAIMKYLYQKGYRLDGNTVVSGKVRKDEEKPWASFQMGFYSRTIFDPYGYPHYITVRARENGSRRVVIESSHDYGRRGRGCIFGMLREKYDHRHNTTEDIINGIGYAMKEAKQIDILFSLKQINLSQGDITNIIERFNQQSGITALKRKDVMHSLHSLPHDGFVRRSDMVTSKIHADVLWVHGNKQHAYNLMLAFNRLLINRRLGDKNNPLVCSEDAAWNSMLALEKIMTSLFDERCQRLHQVLQEPLLLTEVETKLRSIDKIDSLTFEEIGGKLTELETFAPGSLEYCLYYMAYINKAHIVEKKKVQKK